jgi:predicted ribosome quality control (RQC) complex YloA/Tae2 family protein
MHFDALTLACVTAELQATLAGGRAQQIVLTDPYSIGLEIYAQRQRHYLHLSAQPGAGRVHLLTQKSRRGVETETPLLLLLRKYVRGGGLTAITQPDPTERILFLDWEHPEFGPTRLVIEPMGRLSNILLLGSDETIMECLRRVKAGERAQRVLLPGHRYSPPSPQNKLPPWDDGSPDYYTRLQEIPQQEGKLWEVLLRTIAGTSPTQARELAWRAAGKATAPAKDADFLALLQALQELWAPVQAGGWQPGTVQDGGAVIAYSPYPLHFRGEFMPHASISAAMEAFYAHSGTSSGYAAQREQAGVAIRQAQRRLQRQMDALAEDEPAPGEADGLRQQAEWLLALQSKIQPNQKVLAVKTGDPEGSLRIKLDPDLTPVEQARQMFKRAAKLERAAEAIPIRRAQLQTDRAYLEQLENDLRLAENQPEIMAVWDELVKMGLTRAPKGQAKSPRAKRPEGGVLRFYTASGFEIVVGRNARQNEVVTFELAKGDDPWLHARNVPGAHVVVRSNGLPVDEATLQQAAQLAAYYSKLQGETAAEVILSQRRAVRRVPGGHAGQVLVKQERTLIVPGEMPEGVQQK